MTKIQTRFDGKVSVTESVGAYEGQVLFPDLASAERFVHAIENPRNKVLSSNYIPKWGVEK